MINQDKPTDRFDHLEHLLTSMIGSLDQHMNTRFDQIEARFDAQAARLDRHAALIQTDQRALVKASEWSDKVDALLEALTRRIQTLERKLEERSSGTEQ